MPSASIVARTICLFSYRTLQYPEVQMPSFGRLLDGSDEREHRVFK
jgi:hypothetical protein